MVIDTTLLRNCTLTNLERLARSLRVPLPSPLHSDHLRHRILVRDIATALREAQRAAVGAALVAAAFILLGLS